MNEPDTLESLKARAKKHGITIYPKGDGTYWLVDDDLEFDAAETFTLREIAVHLAGMEHAERIEKENRKREYPSGIDYID